MSDGAAAVVAVDVGGTAVKAEVVAMDSTVLARRSTPLDQLRATPQMVPSIIQACVEITQVGRARAAVQAIGVVVPGVVDEAKALGVSSMLLGWSDVKFGELIIEACGLPTALGHDVRTAATAEFEAVREAGQAVQDALFVTVGTGVGAASLIAGALRTGAHGLGGEIAHIPVDPQGPPCPCGKRGCVEVIASAPAIATAYEQRTGVACDAAAVAARALGADRDAVQVWQRAARLLGAAIATYCEILDPALVILGGGVSAAGEQLRSPVADGVRAGLGLPVHPDVRLARLGARAGVVGAAALAWQHAGLAPRRTR